MIDRIRDMAGGHPISAEQLVDACLDILGPMPVVESSRAGLIDYASRWEDLSFADEESAAGAEKHIVTLIQLVVTTQEYQTV